MSQSQRTTATVNALYDRADAMLFEMLAPDITPMGIVAASSKHLDGLSVGREVTVLARAVGRLIALLKAQSIHPETRRQIAEFRRQLRTTTPLPGKQGVNHGH